MSGTSGEDAPASPENENQALAPTSPVRSLSAEQQKTIYEMLWAHFSVILGAPCTRFAGYPFKWEEGQFNVSITAIIEHFGKPQQATLLAKCNKFLKRVAQKVDSQPTLLLKASILQRCEGGIQFEVDSRLDPQELAQVLLMNAIKTSDHAPLWAKIKTYSDFLVHCQIRFNVRPFGGTNISVVRFDAWEGLPIFIMLWLLRQLDYHEESTACGFGKVIVTARNGLPGDDHEYRLHFNTGFIHW